MPPPLITIISATYQAADVLPALVESLEAQTFRDFEWVVRDGGSTDATRAIVESAAVDVRLVSQRDRGIYDAFNSGLDAAEGSWILFLGADDRLAGPTILAEIARSLETAAPGTEALLCSVVDESGSRFSSRLGASTLILNTVHHQGVIYRKSLFESFRYRVESSIVADYELNLILRLRGKRTDVLDLVIAVCDSRGVSHTANEWGLYNDLHSLRRRHVPRILSFLFLIVGLANVMRRRASARRS